MSKSPKTISETITDFLSLRMASRIAIKRSYDDWTIKQMWADKKRKFVVDALRLNLTNHQKFGPDLAVSKFVIGVLSGQIRDHQGIWIKRKQDLPPDYSKAFKCTGIQARNAGLITESIDNFVGLDYLKTIDLSENPRLDDFSCDQLARQFRTSKTLEAINLSHNPFISIYGLEILFRIPSLRRIVAMNTQAAQHEQIDLFTLASLDERQCEVFVHENGKRFRNPEIEDLYATTPRLTDN